METLFEEYEPVKDIMRIGNYAFVKYKKPVKGKRGITNERQAILKEIQDIIEQENGGKINTKVFAMKLSHVPTEDLYWMKSQGLDYRNRSKKPFSKFIYGSIKPKKLSTV